MHGIKRKVRRLGRRYWAKLWKLRFLVNNLSASKEKPDLDAYLQRLFFILGAGRSGTQMLSGLLNLDSKAMVLHEPRFLEDRATRNLARKSRAAAIDYVGRYVYADICKAVRDSNCSEYGEVSGTLRYHVDALLTVFKNADFFILARDGRDVVRSIMGFDFYTETSDIDGDTAPLPGDPHHQTWKEYNRFEKVCWLWADSYVELLKYLPSDRIVLFEKIISDYSYCDAKLMQRLGIEVTRDEWSAYMSHKSPNARILHSYPHWKDWSPEDMHSFDSICGAVMQQLGYNYHWQT